MIVQVIACLLSCLGYFFISKRPKYAYITFIALNMLLYLATFQVVMIFNMMFSTYFLVKLIRNKPNQ